jgi:hypothetical protein
MNRVNAQHGSDRLEYRYEKHVGGNNLQKTSHYKQNEIEYQENDIFIRSDTEKQLHQDFVHFFIIHDPAKKIGCCDDDNRLRDHPHHGKNHRRDIFPFLIFIDIYCDNKRIHRADERRFRGRKESEPNPPDDDDRR